jgi:hypothetical protein
MTDDTGYRGVEGAVAVIGIVGEVVKGGRKLGNLDLVLLPVAVLVGLEGTRKRRSMVMIDQECDVIRRRGGRLEVSGRGR